MKYTTLSDYGIDTQGRTGRDARCLCPECDGLHRNNNKTLSVDTERGIWNCFRCGWSGAVKTGGSELHIYRRNNVYPIDNREHAKKSIKKILNGAVHISKSPEVIEYLINRLGELPSPLPALGAKLGVCYYDQKEVTGYYPVMLGKMRDVSGKLISVHRTYIQKGEKAPVDAPRKMMTAIKDRGLKGCAIHLYEPTDELIVAEGIETSLALFIATGIPVWAATSSTMLGQVDIPDTVKKLIIAGDNDTGRAGQDAADQLALRYQHIETKVIIPKETGTDWLDVLLEKKK